MYNFIFPFIIFVVVLISVDLGGHTVEASFSGRLGSDGRRGELAELPPQWNAHPMSRITHRTKGDLGDLDPRGSVRYNIGPDGRILRGIITKHREVPLDDDGTGIFQAKEILNHQDSYSV